MRGGERIVHYRSQTSAIIQNERVITILGSCGAENGAECKADNLHAVLYQCAVEIEKLSSRVQRGSDEVKVEKGFVRTVHIGGEKATFTSLAILEGSSS